jgi:hypothetical protein
MLGLYIISNIIPIAVGQQTRLAIGMRCGRMAFANASLLAMGGRESVYSDNLRSSLKTVKFFHQAFGLLIILQAIPHGALSEGSSTVRGSSPSVSGIMVRT